MKNGMSLWMKNIEHCWRTERGILYHLTAQETSLIVSGYTR
jgi:hypothetical protein